MLVYLWENEMLEVLPGLGAPRYKPVRAICLPHAEHRQIYGDDYAVEAG
jgi:hypothetical protein